jgi:hypothetical protein
MNLPKSRYHGKPIVSDAKYVWYGDLEDLIRTTYDRPDYRLLDTLFEVSNDSIETFDVGDEGDTWGEIDDLTVDAWLRGEKAGYNGEMDTPRVADLANDLYKRGLIPAGFYCMSVSW